MSYKYAIPLLVVSLCSASWQKANPNNSFAGTPITPETMASFIEPLPEEASYIIDWINEHASMLRFLAATPKPLSSWEEKKSKGNKCLKKNKLENLGSNNYVFKVPNSNWLIKISGPLRRLVNLYVHSTDSDPYIPEEYKRHREFSNKRLLNKLAVVPTYVTISRFANALLCKDVCTTQQITKIHFPEIYLVHIPGCPWEISDDNFIILEKEILSIANICSHKRERKALSRKALREIYTIITHCGIFDFNGENLQLDTKNNLLFIDLEQGMVENPAHFFNKDKEMFDYRVYEGLTSFAETHLAQFDDKYDFFCSLIQKDKSLRKSTEWENIESYFSIKYRKQCATLARKKNIMPTESVRTLEQLLEVRTQEAQ